MPALSEHQRRFNILLAEDNLVNHQSSYAIPGEKGHTGVLVAPARKRCCLGRTAFRSHSDGREMPDMDGFEATAAHS